MSNRSGKKRMLGVKGHKRRRPGGLKSLSKYRISDSNKLDNRQSWWLKLKKKWWKLQWKLKRWRNRNE